MNLSENISRKFQLWTKEFQASPMLRVDKKLVHKYLAENIFVSRVEPLGTEQPDSFICQLAFEPNHTFFFEHPLDHVPGLMLIEAGRQAIITVSHLFLDVPDGKIFIVNKLNTEFKSFAELAQPVFSICTVRNKKYLHGKLYEFQSEGNFIQGEQSIGFMNGTATLYDKSEYQQMRN
jgi:hypothetical protein